MIRGAEQHRSQPQEISGYLEINDLPRATGKQFVRTHPARRQDITGLVGLALVNHVSPCGKYLSSPMQFVQRGHLLTGQNHEGSKFAREWAVRRCHCSYSHDDLKFQEDYER
jgi:hypothetical protein